MLSIAGSMYGQQGRLKGSNTFQTGVGFTDAGILINGFYGRKFDEEIRGIAGVSFATGKVANLNYYGLYVDGIVSYELYSNRSKSYAMNVQGGISFVFDAISDFKSESLNKRHSLNTGGILGLEAEYYITRSLAFLIVPNARYYIKEDFGKSRYQVTAGVRFLL